MSKKVLNCGCKQQQREPGKEEKPRDSVIDVSMNALLLIFSLGFTGDFSTTVERLGE